MSEKIKLEIISPDQTIFKSEVSQVIIPAFEGLMTILKDHIPLITFLRPGIIEVINDNNIEAFYIEEGTVEFSKNNLLILSSTVKNKKDISKVEINEMIELTKKYIDNKNIKDKERYLLSHKIDTLEEINQ
tara:strand:+ start:129 stop:521 length:393 start_codon:yes stop_codon:yes gene_type:complete